MVILSEAKNLKEAVMKRLLQLSVSVLLSFLFLWLTFGREMYPGVAQAVQTQKPIGATVVRDDEIVLLDSVGCVKVVDPWTPPGYQRISFISAESGWTRVTTGDVNGDGDDEIIAFKSDRVQVYDPVVQPGRTATNAIVVGSISPYIWTDLAAGDFDGDGRDEIALLRTDGGGGINGSIYVYDGGTNGTAWTLINTSSYIVAWEHIGVGKFDWDADDDIVVSRYDKDGNALLSTRLGNDTGSAIAELATVGRWQSVAGGQVNAANSPSEVLATRDLSSNYNFYVFYYNLGDYFYTLENPYFLRVAAGDINGDGDDEAVLLRWSSPDVVVYNPPSATAILSLSTGVYWYGLATGDIDGDGRDEIVLAHSTGYRTYNSPESSTDFTDYADNLWTGWDFVATGNIDGDGVPNVGVEMDIQIGEVLAAPISIRHSAASASNPITWTTQNSPTAGTDWFAAVPASGVLVSPAPVTPSVIISADIDMLNANTYPQTKTYQADLLVTFHQKATTVLQTTTLPIKAFVNWPSMTVFPSPLNFSVVASDVVTAFTRTVGVTQRMGQGHGVIWEAHTLGGVPISALDFPLPAWISMTPPAGTQHNTPSIITLYFSGTFTTTHSPYQAEIAIMAPFTVTNNTQQLLIKLSAVEPGGMYFPLIFKDSS
jgi:hypothetical protein